jgi:uncharacterized protein YjaG (DUF416 family)
MRIEDLKSIDDYELLLSAAIAAWSPGQRVALAAAMAERWLPPYTAFSQAQQWGDPASLRCILDTIWACARGEPLALAEQARLAAQVRDSTPHMDDFDAYEALAACTMLDDALECCAQPDNLAPAVRAAHSGFEAAASEWGFDPQAQPRLWRQIAARKELRKQLKLIERIGATAQLDDRTIAALRRDMARPAYLGEVNTRPQSALDPATLTNQASFEQYRRLLDTKLKRPTWANPSRGSRALATTVFAEWGQRYELRHNTISGDHGHGRLSDGAAQQALVARQLALDGAANEIPDWDAEVRHLLELCLRNPLAEYDAKSLGQPHAYGPSLRRLWAEAKQAGLRDDAAWQSIVDWARHRPVAWNVEDQRKRRGLAYTTAALAECLAKHLDWIATDDVSLPWAAHVAGEHWQVRLNDFPDDFMYSLLIGGRAIGSFHDWPAGWRRS